MPTKSDKRTSKAEFRFLRAGHEAREKAGIVAPGIKPFPEWLPEASPRFIWDRPFHKFVCSKLELVTSGEIDRMMFFAPPRHGKSELTTVHYAAWRIIKDPTIRVIIATYGKKLSDKFSRQIKRLVREEVPLSKEKNAANEWETIEGGGLLAVSRGSGVVGFGANLVLIDDWIMKRTEAESEIHRDNAWELYKSGIYTRLEPGAAIVLMNTRWHLDDVPGRLLEEQEEGGDKWEVISLPALAKANDVIGRKPGEALWPERYSAEALERIRRSQPANEWASTYQQEPVPSEGALFKIDWFKDSIRETYPDGLRWVRYWDLAVSVKVSADYTASCAVAFDADGNLWIRDMIRGRWEWPDARKKIVHTMLSKSEAGVRHGIEKAMHGLAAVQDLQRDRKLANIAFKPIAVSVDKYSRALGWADRAEEGKVRLVKGPWIPEFLKELCWFTGKGDSHDDQVDSVSGGAMMIAGRRSAKAY